VVCPKRWSFPNKKAGWGHLGGSVVKRLPSAQVMISGSWDRAPHQAPCPAESPLLPLPLPAAPRLCSLPFSVKQIFFKNTKNNKMIYRMTCSYANKYTYIHIYTSSPIHIENAPFGIKRGRDCTVGPAIALHRSSILWGSATYLGGQG